jgi:hypothetical protein
MEPTPVQKLLVVSILVVLSWAFVGGVFKILLTLS